METLSIIATIVAKPDHRAKVQFELFKLIEPTLKEQGCIKYELFSSSENENLFIFKEEWSSEELLNNHLASNHIAEYMKNTEGIIEEFIVHKLTAIINA